MLSLLCVVRAALVPPTPLSVQRQPAPSRSGLIRLQAAEVTSPFAEGEGGEAPVEGNLELTLENVDRVLDEMRPYLLADGGNVAVKGIEGGIVELELQGACGSCPSSSMTMKMGLERGLREKIPEIVDVVQVAPEGPVVRAARMRRTHSPSALGGRRRRPNPHRPRGAAGRGRGGGGARADTTIPRHGASRPRPPPPAPLPGGASPPHTTAPISQQALLPRAARARRRVARWSS